MRKKILGVMLTICMVLALMPQMAFAAATATNIPYLDASGAQQTCQSATVVTSGDYTWGTDEQTTWYVAQDDVTIDSRVTVTGDVHLILADGCNLTVNGGIYVSNNPTSLNPPMKLSIYGQKNVTGMLYAYASSGSYFAGIGGNTSDCGGITINGGNITAVGDGIGAGIGGGKNGAFECITINGGTVTATGGNTDGSSGIGASGGCDTYGTITISGGTVMAAGKSYGINASPHGTISTGNDGHAVIFASYTNSTGSYFRYSPSKNRDSWRGVIFEGNSGQIYGDGITPSESFEIPSDKTLTIDSGKYLTIPAGKTLTVNGTLTNNGKLYVDGTFTGTADNLYYPLTLVNVTASGDTSEHNSKTYAKAGTTITLTPGTPPIGYVFDSWKVSPESVQINNNNSFTMPNKAITVASKYKDIEAPVISGVKDGETYCSAQTVTVSDNDAIKTVTVNGTAVKLDEHNQFTLSPADGEQKIIATDNAGNSKKVTVTVNNGHTGGKATCTSKAICDICKTAYGDLDSHNHVGGTRIRYAKRATCTETGFTGDTYCNGCNRKLYSGTLIEKLAHTDGNKDHSCDVCELEISKHTGGKATCTSKAVCDYCGSEYGEPDINNHDIENIPEMAPTYSEAGYKEHWQCKECKIYFSDEEGNIQIDDIDAWKAGEGKIDKLIPPKTDSVTSDKDGNISVSIEKSIATNDGVTEVAVSDTVAETIISKLETSDSKNVVITAVTGSTVSGPSMAKPGTSIQISLPESAVKQLAEIEGVKITIVTDNGSIVLDKGTLEAIASKSGEGGKVNLVIETVEQTGSLLKLELTLKTSGGEVSDFGSGSVEVTVTISDELKTKNPVCVYIDEQGTYYMIGGRLNDDGTFTFVTGHFSTYAIMPEEEVASVIKVQTAEAEKAAIKNVNTTVSLTTKKIKKGIKVTVKVPASKKADKTGVIIYRSQKKSSGYVLYKKVRTSGSSYTVTNTKNIKGKRLTKGKRYYYKARAYKVIDGKTYYGPMSAVKYAKAR